MNIKIKMCTRAEPEKYGFSKSGKLLSNHPQGTHDDRFWALAVYAAEQTPPPASSPIVRTI